jgi:dienelactone hydrolase
VTAAEKFPVVIKLIQRDGRGLQTLDTATINLRVRDTHQTYKQTFVSTIDGSVQYYAVNPPQLPIPRASSSGGGNSGNNSPALFLTLHGAGVEAIGQADAYNNKSWGYIVAPTNRRPYGFDWEDWGRMDALEVLGLAMQRLHTDPQRTYLTGHSMGGHGVWILGATFPDRFAAIGPSAGWISWATYGGGRAVRDDHPGAVQEMSQRAAASSDTLTLMHNYAQFGVYILHGAADDNVPVAQARTMNQNLSAFHHDFLFHEQPGAGHWWNASDEPGASCVDWPPMFDFFARHTIPEDASIRQIDFVTANPGVSAWSHWAGIEAQVHPLKPSSVSIRYDPGHRRFTGTTENVARLSLRLGQVPPGKPMLVDLDGQKIDGIVWPAGTPQIWLVREGEKWSLSTAPSSSWKGPQRNGPFKEAFRNRLILVYGTNGSPDENAWAFAKARYDAEQFWYRGNGSLDLMADDRFQASVEPDRDVILYGNAQTNSAWNRLLANSPVQVGRGSIHADGREETGEDLACLFLRPRPGSDRASVGVVTGTGLAGMRLTDRLTYFTSGVAYPDCIILGPDVLAAGNAGVRAAGFFGIDWSVDSGEFAWR